MLRFLLPPSKPNNEEITREECIAMAFHLARHAPFEDDKKQAMHAACSYLERGLWLWQFD